MTENDDKIKIHDLLFGSVYVPDNYDDSEIKKMWQEHEKWCHEISISLQEWEQKEHRKYISKGLITVFTSIGAIICLSLLFSHRC